MKRYLYISVAMVAAILVAALSVLFVDHARKAKLSDYGIATGMSLTQAETCMKRPPDVTTCHEMVPKYGPPIVIVIGATWRREHIDVRIADDKVIEIMFSPDPSLLDRLCSSLPSFSWRTQRK